MRVTVTQGLVDGSEGVSSVEAQRGHHGACQLRVYRLFEAHKAVEPHSLTVLPLVIPALVPSAIEALFLACDKGSSHRGFIF